jgi:GNAT superfamily N-acetyltransferase
MSDIRVDPLNRLNVLHLEQVKTLGMKNTKTLGLFPPAAFDDYARRGGVLVAVAPNGNCVGYILFSTANDRATIFHLCVDDGQRNKGLGRLLVDALATRTKHLRGLILKCRRDYDANKIWPRLGFHALNLTPGRRKAGSLLVTWWRSSGGLDLFSDTRKQLAEVKLPVVIDANIIFDFQGRKKHTNATSLTAAK